MHELRSTLTNPFFYAVYQLRGIKPKSEPNSPFSKKANRSLFLSVRIIVHYSILFIALQSKLEAIFNIYQGVNSGTIECRF